MQWIKVRIAAGQGDRHRVGGGGYEFNDVHGFGGVVAWLQQAQQHGGLVRQAEVVSAGVAEGDADVGVVRELGGSTRNDVERHAVGAGGQDDGPGVDGVLRPVDPAVIGAIAGAAPDGVGDRQRLGQVAGAQDFKTTQVQGRPRGGGVRGGDGDGRQGRVWGAGGQETGGGKDAAAVRKLRLGFDPLTASMADVHGDLRAAGDRVTFVFPNDGRGAQVEVAGRE